MPLKNREKKFVTLRSRGNEVVRVVSAGDRAFLEQADKLVLELAKRIEDKTADPAMPRFDFQGVGESFEPIIYYWSSNSGGTRRAAEKLATPSKPIGEVSEVGRPFIIMSPSFDQPKGGFTPKSVEKFLEEHGHWLVGVLGAGNLNFGEHYCQAAKDISAQHKVPVLHRIDIMGNEHDYETIDRGVEQHWGTLLNMKGLA